MAVPTVDFENVNAKPLEKPANKVVRKQMSRVHAKAEAYAFAEIKKK